MQSYFSRFLHHTLSHSDVREVFTSSLSLSDLIGESRLNKVANLSNLDYRVKPDNDRRGKDVSLKPDGDSVCAGRSMVEMLGVLAIIGVLSVGAIAGYGKAMLKYKLNQHAQAVNMLINNVLQLKEQLQYEPNNTTFYGTLLHKMNLLPDGIIYENNATLKDSWFKNKINIYYNNKKWTSSDGTEAQNNFGAIGFHFAPSSGGAEVCRNIVIAAKENSSNLHSLVTYKYYNDTDKGIDDIGTLHGDAYCSSQQNCLHYLDLNKIESLCNACNEKACRLYVTWK